MKYDDSIYTHYSIYRKLVDTLTESLRLSGVFELSRGESVDHILPVSFGFNWRIPPNIMADKRNLRVITIIENSSKGHRCTEIPKFIQKYMINTHERTMKENPLSSNALAGSTPASGTNILI